MIASRISSVAARLAFRTRPSRGPASSARGRKYSMQSGPPIGRSNGRRGGPGVAIAREERRRQVTEEALEFERDRDGELHGEIKRLVARARRGTRIDEEAFAAMPPEDVETDPWLARAAARLRGRRGGLARTSDETAEEGRGTPSSSRTSSDGRAGGGDRAPPGGDRRERAAPAGARALPRGARLARLSLVARQAEVVRSRAAGRRLVARVEQARRSAATGSRSRCTWSAGRGSPPGSRSARPARAPSCARAAPSRASSACGRSGACRARRGSARAGRRPPCRPGRARPAAASRRS